MNNERFIRKQIYQVGQFYQIDSFNSVYLDKTGELIAVSEGKLKNWNGNMNEFHFNDEEKPYNGKVSSQNYWYNNPRQGDYDSNELPNFIKFIKSSNELIDSVYKPKYYTRIGLRMQYVLRKTTNQVKDNYKQFYKEKFKKLLQYGNIDTTAIGFETVNDVVNIKTNINYVMRNTDNDINAPKDGLMFDLDFYKTLDKVKKADAFDQNERILTYANDKWADIVSSIAEEMEII